jgi:hypothetical protein
MATLLLGVASSGLATATGVTAAAAGGSIGASFVQAGIGAVSVILGSYIDNLLFGGIRDRTHEGPRLTELKITGSTEGAPILEVFGNVRVAGQLIWATRHNQIETPDLPIKIKYTISLAIAICKGPVSMIRRVWADQQFIDQSDSKVRIYYGDQTQDIDPLMTTIQGSGNVPSYRGVCYIVLEDLDLQRFGNRIPIFNFEVVNTLPKTGGSVEDLIQAVTMIPGSTEHGYDPLEVKDVSGFPTTENETSSEQQTRSDAQRTEKSAGTVVNIQNKIGYTDWKASLDELQKVCKNVKSVLLVIAWMGSDLRLGECKIRPKIEYKGGKVTNPIWKVNNITRQDAILVSYFNGSASYGSSPSDGSVIRAIKDLKERGLEVIFYPLIMMDIPQGSTLPNPYSPGQNQPSYPWRGRITCFPAPGVPNSPDKSSAVNAEIDKFFGTAIPSDFIFRDETTIFRQGVVVAEEDEEWGFNRMVLHYAHLCANAGGVDSFIIGTELRGITSLRSSTSTYPAVDKLVELSSHVRTVVGSSTKIGYSADWSEYAGHDPYDGSNDFAFHLDTLWASSNIDFVGIDNYLPMSDWREGRQHLDSKAGFKSIYDIEYLHSNIEGGEYYDWYYSSEGATGNEASVDRINQNRRDITDGRYNKPWVYRKKDFKNWWLNFHFNREAGAEVSSHTAWVPQSKPIVFTEAGTAAVDRSTNQPNVFVDDKSFESFKPYFSMSRRDDYMQRQFLRSIHSYWEPSKGNNPSSNRYSGSMLDSDRIHIWTWDARPYPAFPNRTDYWSDAKNWSENHWITGRMGFVDLKDLVLAIALRSGAPASRIDASSLEGTVQGYVIDRRMSSRAALNQLMSLYRFSAIETDGKIKFQHRNQAPTVFIPTADLIRDVTDDDSNLYNIARSQETDLPRVLSFNYIDTLANYRQSVVDAKNRTTTSTREDSINYSIGLNTAQAQGIVESLLSEVWAGREKLDFTLPMKYWYLEPGDVITFSLAGFVSTFRIITVIKEFAIQVECIRMDESSFTVIPGTDRDPIKVKEVQECRALQEKK